METDEKTPQEGSSQDRMHKWDILIDERIRTIIGDGDMSWHPKAGSKIELDEDQYTPADERISRKIMKDSDSVPPWVALAYTLRDKREKFIIRSQQYADDYIRRKSEAIRAGSFVREQQIEKRWQEATQRLSEEIHAYNRELLDYNLQIPPQIGQMIPIDSADLLQKALGRARRKYQS